MTWHALVDLAFSERLCLTLLHSVWQVSLLALIAWCVDRLWRGRSVERCYTIHVAALVAALAAMPITYLLLDAAERPSAPTVMVSTSTTVAQSEPTSITTSPKGTEFVVPVERQATNQATGTQSESDVEALAPVVRSPSPVTHSAASRSPRWLLLAPWIVALYAAGVVLMLARLVVAVIRTSRLAAHADLVTDGPLIEALRSLACKWSMKAVPALAHAERIVVPAVVGLARPMILLPASAMSGMTMDQLEMILSHELAHVRRHDMWINLVQRLAETVLFFNPALWYLSRKISTVREYCCDEMTCRTHSAITLEPRVRYATALLRVVELAKPDPATSRELASLAASGRSPSEIRRRVARLFGEPLREPLRVSRGGVATLILLGAALAIGLPVWNTQAKPPAIQTDSETGTVADKDDTSFAFQLNVVGPDGVFVPKASVEIRTTPKPTADQIQRGEYLRDGSYGAFAQADDKGRLGVTFARRPKQLNFSIEQPGYGPYWAGWSTTSHPQVIPQEFTAELDEGWSVGGVVVDGEGRPVEDVKVAPSIDYKKRPGDTEQLGVGTQILTDAEGRWQFDHVPASKHDVHVAFDHPDYGPLRIQLARNGFEVKQDATPTGRIELKQGLTVIGTVTDSSGQPIPGALVRTKFMNDIREARTDQQGVYRLVGCEPRMTRIVVSAKGRATDMQEVRVDPDMAPVDFTMQPGGKVHIRVVDQQGNGIPKSRIFFQRWRGMFQYFEFDHVGQYTDERGVWEWNEAPLDEFKADICRPGGMQLSEQSLIAREEEYVFSPPTALVVSGRVVDAKTKEPIETFRVIPGHRYNDPPGRISWNQGDSYEVSDGRYLLRFAYDNPAHLVRIEAKGYQVAISRNIMTDEGAVDVDFELQPVKDIAATILTAAGQAAANAKIAVVDAGSRFSIDNGDIEDDPTDATRLDADVDGRFSIPARDEPFQLVITHAMGFANSKSADGPIPNRITLTAWARAEGTFRVGPRPAPNVKLWLTIQGFHSRGDDASYISLNHTATTDKDGRFVFERVFPGPGRIERSIRRMVDDGVSEGTSSPTVSADFVAGETTALDLGGTGRPVAGKLAPPADYSERVSWRFASVHINVDVKPMPLPKDVRDNPQKFKDWYGKWSVTDEGKAWTSNYEASQDLRITALIDRDGFFRIDDVPAGDYVLRVIFSGKTPGVLSDYRFTVPAVEEGQAAEPLDLGTLMLNKQ